MNEEIREKIFSLANEKYKKFQSSLCPKTNNIVGVKIPDLRKLSKEILKGDFRQYLNSAKNDYYEEIMLQGMVISLSKMELSEKLEYTKNFIPKIDNWAVCDIFCSGFKFRKDDLNIVWNFINKYLDSNKEFEIRFVVVMHLNYYINEEYIDDVLKNLDKIKNEKYYSQMAIAWAISICFIKFRDKTFDYLKNNSLSDFVYNKSIQKIIESYRVDQKDKELLKKMKRR